MSRSTILLILAACLMVASHNVPAWDSYDYGYDSNVYGGPGVSLYDPYSSTMPQDSYVTPHVWGGGYTETYPGRGSITVSPNGLGGYSIHRSGFLPRNRW